MAAKEQLNPAVPLIAIGGSTGGPRVLRTLLSALPEPFPAALIICQHLEETHSQGLINILNDACRLPVVGAQEGAVVEAGQVLVSQTNDHLTLDSKGRVHYRSEPSSALYRPSVDELFASVALHWQGPVMAVLLTGMGSDGAKGLLALRRLNAYTLAQDEESCAVYGMPKAAALLNAAMEMLPPERLVEVMMSWADGQHLPKEMMNG